MRIIVFGIITTLLTMLAPARLAAQSTWFSDFPIWSSDPTNETKGIGLGDVDGDGDLDLMYGNSGNSNTFYSNIKNPVYKRDLLVPTNQVPNNGPFIGSAPAGVSDENHYSWESASQGSTRY